MAQKTNTLGVFAALAAVFFAAAHIMPIAFAFITLAGSCALTVLALGKTKSQKRAQSQAHAATAREIYDELHMRILRAKTDKQLAITGKRLYRLSASLAECDAQHLWRLYQERKRTVRGAAISR